MNEPSCPEHQPTDLPPALADRRFEGRQAFTDTIIAAIECGAPRGWRCATFCDADFADWPLDGRNLSCALDAWARSGCRFTLLAQRYDVLVHRHDRFVHWRRRWSHRIDCWQYRAAATSIAVPSTFLTPAWSLQRIDTQRDVCVVSSDRARRMAMQEHVDRLLHRSVPGFAAFTLGL